MKKEKSTLQLQIRELRRSLHTERLRYETLDKERLNLIYENIDLKLQVDSLMEEKRLCTLPKNPPEYSSATPGISSKKRKSSLQAQEKHTS